MPASPDGTDLFLSSGTWSLVGFESEKPVLGAEALAARISNERIGDGRYRPLTNVIGLWLLEGTMKDFASRPSDDKAWAALITAAEKLPAPAALLDVTDPAFTNPSSMKAAIDAQLKKRKLPMPKNLAAYTRLDLRLARPRPRRRHARVRENAPARSSNASSSSAAVPRTGCSAKPPPMPPASRSCPSPSKAPPSATSRAN